MQRPIIEYFIKSDGEVAIGARNKEEYAAFIEGLKAAKDLLNSDGTMRSKEDLLADKKLKRIDLHDELDMKIEKFKK